MSTTRTHLAQLYACPACGTVVEVTNEGLAGLACCGQPMTLVDARTEDDGAEKHLPVCEARDGTLAVLVGSTRHPMERAHHITWIEVVTDEGVHRHHLQPGQEPEAFFPTIPGKARIRQYCNVHGLWELVYTGS